MAGQGTTDDVAVGIVYANTGGLGSAEGAVALAEACDRHGVESVWTVEHVVLPAGFTSPYPYAKDGAFPLPEEAPIPDPLIWLTWVAAHSRHVRVATGILILPQRNPVVLAKETATLDAMSGGRLMLGVGVGWLREEFDALGVPWDGRGRRTDEYIEAMRALWTEAEPTYHGTTVAFDGAKMHPKPAQGSIPVHVGGHSDAAARRAGRLGDGFFPGPGRDTAALVEVMRAAAVDAGRDPDAIEVTVGAAPSPTSVQRLREMGARRLVTVPPAFDPDGADKAVEQMMDRIAGG